MPGNTENAIRDVINRGIEASVIEVGEPFDGDAAARMMTGLPGQVPQQYATLLQMYSRIDLAGEMCYGFNDPDGLLDIDVRNRDRRGPDGSPLPDDALVIMEDAGADLYYLRTTLEHESPVFRIDADLLETREEAKSVVAWLEDWINEYG